MGRILNILVDNYFGETHKDYRIPNGIHKFLPKSNNSQITMVKNGGAFFSNDVLENFKLNFIDLKSTISKDLKYLYLIELNTPKGLYSSFQSIPKKVMDLVNQDRCYIIINYSHEGQFDYQEYGVWYNQNVSYLEDYIKLENIFFVISDLSKKETLDKTLKINIIESIFFLENFAYDLKKINNKTKLVDFDYDFELKKISDIDISNKSKKFLCYMRNSDKPHRISLACFFEKQNMWNDNNISLLKVGDFRPHFPAILDNLYTNEFNKLTRDKTPIELDTQNLNRTNLQNFSTTFAGDWKHYQETFLSVVSETLFEDENIFFSEKICKPIVNLHPFIVVSSFRFLEKLRDFGFKTFSPFIDESYDVIKNPKQRLEKIFSELERINNMSNDDLKQWWTQILPILEHNQKTLLEYSNKKTTMVKLLEKLYD